MLRFTRNRWWVFILALVVFALCLFAASARFPSVARADSSGGTQSLSDPLPGDSGDPDVPTGSNPTKGTGWSTGRGYVGSMANTTPSLEVLSTGEGTASEIVWMQRIHLVLLTLRGFLLRF